MKINIFFMQEQNLINKKFYSTGGRVLNFVSIDENFKLAREKSLNLIKNLKLEKWTL